METKNSDEIQRAVRRRYGEIARQDTPGCGCSPIVPCCGMPPGSIEKMSQAYGYTKEQIDSVPEGANMGLGCGNPQAIASLKPGETVLDLGSGGGFDCFLAAKSVGESGRVIGVDMTADMVSKARRNSEKLGVKNVEFRLGEIEHLPVADNTADIIMSNCVINLSPDKAKVFNEVFRVLKPGGCFTCYEWMRIDAPYSDDMLRWLKLEELTYVLETTESFAQMIRDAGFADVQATDASDWYRRECRREYELIRGDLYPRMVELLGQDDADHFVENWEAMTVVCESGEMRQAYFRGQRPA